MTAAKYTDFCLGLIRVVADGTVFVSPTEKFLFDTLPLLTQLLLLLIVLPLHHNLLFPSLLHDLVYVRDVTLQ